MNKMQFFTSLFKRHPFYATVLGLALIAAVVLLSGCTQGDLERYCQKSPEERAELRARLHLPQIIYCEDDLKPVAPKKE